MQACTIHTHVYNTYVIYIINAAHKTYLIELKARRKCIRSAISPVYLKFTANDTKDMLN